MDPVQEYKIIWIHGDINLDASGSEAEAAFCGMYKVILRQFFDSI